MRRNVSGSQGVRSWKCHCINLQNEFSTIESKVCNIHPFMPYESYNPVGRRTFIIEPLLAIRHVCTPWTLSKTEEKVPAFIDLIF